MNKQITLIGGDGLMGQLFTKLFSTLDFTINVIGENDWGQAPAILSNTDWLIISVPINVTASIIQKAAALIHPECVLSDFTSLKTEPLLQMLSSHSGPVVGLHPMFGPTILNTDQQVIVICHGRDKNQYQWCLDGLAKLGFTLTAMGAREHDNAMNFIQGIEHFLTFGLGSFLQHKSQHPQELMQLSSPIYLAKLLLMGRIFDQDPQLYADIIMATPERIKLIKEFCAWLSAWVNKLEQENGKAEFINEFKAISRWMGNFTHLSQQQSDKFLANF